MTTKNFWLNVLTTTLTISATMMLAMTAASCSDETMHEGMETQQQTLEQEPADHQSPLIQEEQKTDLLMQSLCDVSGETRATATYTPRIGKALYPSTPTTLYTVADTREEAEAIYQSMVAHLGDGSAPVGHDVRQGDIHLTFTPGASASETARILVDCPRLSQVMTAIVLVPAAAWPGNATSPIPFLSVLRQRSTGHVYLCVREPFGCDGLLLTFDGGWSSDGFDSDWQGKFTMNMNCAKQEVFNCLGLAMTKRPDAMEAMLKVVDERISRYLSGQKIVVSIPRPENKTKATLTALFRDKREMTFDCDYSYSKGRWWLATNYYITLRKAIFKNRAYTSDWKYYEHTKKPKLDTPSHSKTFGAKYKVDDAEWEWIYKPGSSGKRSRR